ncbi:hypothetical protein, partial [Klebsiella pneumoniae]|uniref:hypothetical protein n=1 Tax=Klebsiella pneumoniae TaxID=573 RepID=UPI0040553A61
RVLSHQVPIMERRKLRMETNSQPFIMGPLYRARPVNLIFKKALKIQDSASSRCNLIEAIKRSYLLKKS